MVRVGQVRELDRLGNDAADEAADFGRCRVGHVVVGAGRDLSGVGRRWYLVILQLHRFFIAMSCVVVDHDGDDGTGPDPHIWSAGSLPSRRRFVHVVRNYAMLLGLAPIWSQVGSVFSPLL